MGTFFDTPTVGTRTAFALPAAAVQTRLFITGTFDGWNGEGYGAGYASMSMPVAFDAIPWGDILTGVSIAAGGAPVTDFSSWQTTVDSATAAAAAQLAALTAALADETSAQNAVNIAQGVLDGANAALFLLEESAFVAWLGLLAAQRENDAALIASYTTSVQEAVQAVVAQTAVVATSQTAVAAAAATLAAKQGAVAAFLGFDDGVSEILAAQLQYTLAQYAVGSQPLAGGPVNPPYANPYSTSGSLMFPPYATPTSFSRGATVASSRTDTHFTVTVNGQYQLSFILNDGQYQQLAADGGNIRVAWTEVTYAYDTTETTFDTVAGVAQKSAVLSAGDGVQLVDGSQRWLFATDPVSVSAPDGNQYVVVAGPDQIKNQTNVALEVRGATAARQGWQEYTTDPSAAYGRRYLTMTLSAADNAPEGNNYSGTYSFLDPNWTTVTDPALLAAIDQYALPGDENPIALVSTVLSPTVRVLNDPPGLQLTLSDEETPASIQAAAAAACVFDDPTVTSSIAGVGGAINDCPATGDYAAQQALRYNVSYTSAASRGFSTDGWSDYFEITKKTTDLTTGVTTSVQIPFTVDFAYSPPNGPEPTNGNGFADAEYTVVGVPPPLTLIEIFASPSNSTDPSTPYGSPTLSYATGDSA